MELPRELIVLMKQPSTAYIATLMPDGSPQLSQTWIDTDGQYVIFNTPEEFQKARNLRRDPRIAITVSDPAEPSRYYAVRGRVISMTRKGGADHIETLAQRYLGGPYPWYGGREQTRVTIVISIDKIHLMGH